MRHLNDGITAKSVKECRERTGLGLMEIKNLLQKENALLIIEEATSIEDIKDVLRMLVHRK